MKAGACVYGLIISLDDDVIGTNNDPDVDFMLWNDFPSEETACDRFEEMFPTIAGVASKIHNDFCEGVDDCEHCRLHVEYLRTHPSENNQVDRNLNEDHPLFPYDIRYENWPKGSPCDLNYAGGTLNNLSKLREFSLECDSRIYITLIKIHAPMFKPIITFSDSE